MENVDPTRAMDAPNSTPPAAKTLSVPAAAPPQDPLSIDAADLAAAATLAQAKAADSVSLNVPEFRESSAEEIRQAELLLREAHLARRRENYRLAETKCREAIALVPKDASALELLGDLMQDVARINEALAAYRRATEADPKRSSAERKYADLLMRQQDWGGIDLEAVPKNPWFSVLLSLLLPGAGQIHNGEPIKGLILMVSAALCLLGWSLGSTAPEAGTSAKGTASPPGVSAPTARHATPVNTKAMIPMVLGGMVYIYALADANLGARRRKTLGKLPRGKTGWEI